jgi:hypothetical protein
VLNFGDLLNSIWIKLFKNPLAPAAGNLAIKNNKVSGYSTALPNWGDQLDTMLKIKKEGIVLWDKQLRVKESDRRARGRTVTFLFKDLFYNYFISYLWYKFTKKSLGLWGDIR